MSQPSSSAGGVVSGTITHSPPRAAGAEVDDWVVAGLAVDAHEVAAEVVAGRVVADAPTP